jgi:hypothetical protein
VELSVKREYLRWLHNPGFFANSFDIDADVVTTYDTLNRTLTRTYPDGGMERYGYSGAGLVAYTN